MEELNNFLNFLLERENFFNLEIFWIFFDTENNYDIVEKKLKDFQKPSLRCIFLHYEEIYPEFTNVKFLPSYREIILDYKSKIEVNIDFYKVW